MIKELIKVKELEDKWLKSLGKSKHSKARRAKTLAKIKKRKKK